MIKFKSSRTKPKTACYIINEKNQISWYWRGYCHFVSLLKTDLENVVLMSVPLNDWCKKWMPLKDICDKDVYIQSGGDATYNSKEFNNER